MRRRQCTRVATRAAVVVDVAEAAVAGRGQRTASHSSHPHHLTVGTVTNCGGAVRGVRV